MTPQEIKVLIEFALDIKECRPIENKVLLDLLLPLDPNEVIFHIEFPGIYNRTPFPVLWHIRLWRESSEKWSKDREREDKERKIAYERECALRKLTSAIIAKTGLTVEQAATVAYGLLAHNRDAAKFVFNTDLTAVPNAMHDDYLINRLLR